MVTDRWHPTRLACSESALQLQTCSVHEQQSCKQAVNLFLQLPTDQSPACAGRKGWAGGPGHAPRPASQPGCPSLGSAASRSLVSCKHSWPGRASQTQSSCCAQQRERLHTLLPAHARWQPGMQADQGGPTRHGPHLRQPLGCKHAALTAPLPPTCCSSHVTWLASGAPASSAPPRAAYAKWLPGSAPLQAGVPYASPSSAGMSPMTQRAVRAGRGADRGTWTLGRHAMGTPLHALSTRACKSGRWTVHYWLACQRRARVAVSM